MSAKRQYGYLQEAGMIKLHISLWQFLAGGAALGVLGLFAIRAREFKERLRRVLKSHERAVLDRAVRSYAA
jgi:hypothetical protein